LLISGRLAQDRQIPAFMDKMSCFKQNVQSRGYKNDNAFLNIIIQIRGLILKFWEIKKARKSGLVRKN
jgi:hypothetical protein